MMKKIFLFSSLVLISLWTFAQDDETSSFVVVEKSAEFPGGIPKFYQYVLKNLKYPKSARKAKLSGKVYVEFVINRDGSVDSLSVRALSANEKLPPGMPVLSEILENEDCKAEAIRVIRSSPQWIPGTQKGKPVRQLMIVPIIFKY